MPIVAIRGSLVIQSANATLTIPPGKQVIVLGREDPVSSVFPDIDLDPYGAQEEGVGRKHAQLVMRGGDICIEDLESVNGTVVNKQRLVPRQPQPIKDGDEIRLGKMVMIYKAG
jgi:pSer/pThr/pTyr-binding forkhead associated (FHA) protein